MACSPQLSNSNRLIFSLSQSTRINHLTFNVDPDMLMDICRLWLGCGVLPILFSVTSSTCPFSSQLRRLHLFWASTWHQQSPSWLRTHLDLLLDLTRGQLPKSLQGKVLLTRTMQQTWRAVMHNYLETVRHLWPAEMFFKHAVCLQACALLSQHVLNTYKLHFGWTTNETQLQNVR